MGRKETYTKMLILLGRALSLNESPLLFCISFLTPYMNDVRFLKKLRGGERKKLGIPVEDG